MARAVPIFQPPEQGLGHMAGRGRRGDQEEPLEGIKCHAPALHRLEKTAEVRVSPSVFTVGNEAGLILPDVAKGYPPATDPRHIHLPFSHRVCFTPTHNGTWQVG